MEEQVMEKKGMLERVLTEILKTPRFKATLNIMLSSMDSKTTASLVRALFWTDPGIILSLVGTLPTLINMGVEVLRESVAQFNTFPVPTMLDLMDSLIVTVDGAAVGEAAANINILAKKFETESGEKVRAAVQDLVGDLHQGYRDKLGLPSDAPFAIERWIAGLTERAKDPESLTSQIIEAAAQAMRNNPEFSTHVMRPLLESVFAAQLEGGVA